MDVPDFIQHCRSELNQVYQLAKSGTPDKQLQYRTEGLVQAAKLLGLVTTSELQQIFEEEHLSVFGETVAERKARKDSFAELK